MSFLQISCEVYGCDLSFHVLKGMVVFVHSLFVSIPDNADDVLRV